MHRAQSKKAALLKLWSIQSTDAWDELQSQGWVTGRPNFERDWEEAPSHYWGFRFAYGWMRSQMERRLGPAPVGCLHPMWAWARPPYMTSKGAPDLRSMREEKAGVLLELEVDPKDALLSDHGSWHMVLNGSLLSLSEALDADADRRLQDLCSAHGKPMKRSGALGPEHFALPAVIEFLSLSWERVFDVAPLLPGEPARMAFPPEADPTWIGIDSVSVQACLWRIEASQVISSRTLRARSRGACP